MTRVARDQLGDAIDHYVRERGLRPRDVARRIGVSEAEVERYMRGEAVPNGGSWKRLSTQVAKGLQKFRDLYARAMAEQDEEREMLVRSLRRNEGHKMDTKNGAMVNFGDKLVAAGVMKVNDAAPQEKPAESPPPSKPAEVRRGSDGRSIPAPHPPGSMTTSAVTERREFARGIIATRPHIKGDGPDGLQEIVRQRFGVGISPGEITKIKDELRRERIEREIRAKIAGESRPESPQLPPAASAPVAIAEPPRQVNDADVSTAVDLLLGAIPGLQTLRIEVNDRGEASVTYDVRKVQVTTVSQSLTVKRQ